MVHLLRDALLTGEYVRPVGERAVSPLQVTVPVSVLSASRGPSRISNPLHYWSCCPGEESHQPCSLREQVCSGTPLTTLVHLQSILKEVSNLTDMDCETYAFHRVSYSFDCINSDNLAPQKQRPA